MFPLLQPRNHNNNINNNHKISTYTDGYIQMDMSIPEKKVTKKNILCREALCCVLSSRYQIMPYVHIYIYIWNVRKSHRKKTNKTKHWTMVLNLFWQLASSSDTSIFIYMCVFTHIYIYINTIPFYISHHNRAAHLHLQAAAAPVQVHAGA